MDQLSQTTGNAPLPKISVVDDDPDLLMFSKDLARARTFCASGCIQQRARSLINNKGMAFAPGVGLLAAFAQDRKKLLSVHFVPKDAFLAVSAVHHVLNRSWVLDA